MPLRLKIFTNMWLYSWDLMNYLHYVGTKIHTIIITVEEVLYEGIHLWTPFLKVTRMNYKFYGSSIMPKVFLNIFFCVIVSFFSILERNDWFVHGLWAIEMKSHRMCCPLDKSKDFISRVLMQMIDIYFDSHKRLFCCYSWEINMNEFTFF